MRMYTWDRPGGCRPDRALGFKPVYDYCAGQQAGTRGAILVANATTFTNYNLDASTTYWYRVRASSGSLYSGYSNVATITTAPPSSHAGASSPP